MAGNRWLRFNFGRTLFLACALLLFSLITLNGRDSKQDQSAASKKAIRKVLDMQAAAWNKGDLEAFMTGYWKSPDLMFFSGKDKTCGWEATLKRYRKKYQSEGRKMGKLTFRELEIEVLGPTSAWVRGRWKVVLDKETPSGLFTLILKKMPEGWRIVHDHTSAGP
jgi:beta-aspartyl-peptidase (threonine type)